MPTEKAEKPERLGLEIRTRTPKKPGIFDAVGKNRQAALHPVREMFESTERVDSEDAIPTEDSRIAESTPTSSSSTSSMSTPSSMTTPTSPPTPATLTTPSTRRSSTSRSSGTSLSKGANDSRFDVAPGSDFQKYPNANVREIPNGLFPGKTKVVYDVLYSLTRGAITPSRTHRISKPRLMAKAGIGSKVTIDKAIEHLKAFNMISVEERPGEHEGNVYEVLIFGEHPTHSKGGARTSTTSPTRLTAPGQNVDGLLGAKSSPTTPGTSAINIEPPAEPKTFFKDFLNPDDERPLHEALDRFELMVRNSTGRELTPADCAGLSDILHIILDEAATATARAGSVSCFGKFAAEHIRRRLRSKNWPAPRTEFFDPGRPESSTDSTPVAIGEDGLDPEPLGERREQEYLWLAEIAANNGVEYTENTYASMFTEDDWAWLKGKLLEERTA